MNNAELKEALFNRRQIIADLPNIGELRFAWVHGIIYRAGNDGKLSIAVELMDRNENSICVTSPERIKYADKGVVKYESNT